MRGRMKELYLLLTVGTSLPLCLSPTCAQSSKVADGMGRNVNDHKRWRFRWQSATSNDGRLFVCQTLGKKRLIADLYTLLLGSGKSESANLTLVRTVAEGDELNSSQGVPGVVGHKKVKATCFCGEFVDRVGPSHDETEI